MSLQMKVKCEKCDNNVYDEAYICVHECTFCYECTSKMAHICPNCSGELVRRPKHAAACPLG